MLTDLRNAFRALRAMPSFTAVAVIILMLGIGASTAIFSVVDAVMLRGLPFDQADRLVSVAQRVRSPVPIRGKYAVHGAALRFPTFSVTRTAFDSPHRKLSTW